MLATRKHENVRRCSPESVARSLLIAAPAVHTGYILDKRYRRHRGQISGNVYLLCPGRNTVLWKSVFVLWMIGPAATGI